MMADGVIVGDGTWMLKVYVTDLQIERSLRVKGDLHIGGVMLRLVEDLDIAMDWSDHALWWPQRNSWLTRTRSTLDQYGVQADSLLEFTPMHKTLRVQLPDLRYLDCRVDFSIKTFNAVLHLCKELGIRHPEELSFCKPLEPHHLKHNLKDLLSKKSYREHNGSLPADTNTFIANGSPAGSQGSLDKSYPPFMCAPITPMKHSSSTPISSPLNNNNGTLGSWHKKSYSEINGSYSPVSWNGNVSTLEMLNGSLDSSLASSPNCTPEARSKLLKPKNIVERARLNVGWLDSSLSIYEQGVKEFDTLRLRFKFYSIYDLNGKTDAVRINQLYEQAKWQLLSEEIDCTEEEALMFAALQVQINLQSGIPQPLTDTSSVNLADDDIDAALTDLQVTLEGSHISYASPDIMHVPELFDYLKCLKPKRFTMKAYKRLWVTCRELQLRFYKSREDAQHSSPLNEFSLRGCEVTPDVNLAQGKFVIKLEVPAADGMSEMFLRCENEDQYASWMAACRLASKGRTLADSSYEAERKSILSFLTMQKPAPTPIISPDSLKICPEDYVSNRYVKKLKSKLSQRILEAHANVKDLGLTEAKLSYIRAWQSLPDYGLTLFVIKPMGHKKEELLGVTPTRLMRMELSSGDHIKTWRYNTVIAWNVNWEVKHMMLQLDDGNFIFACHSADCKVVHEFIGGYIFLSMRSKDANQSLNEDMFHKLTGGWA